VPPGAGGELLVEPEGIFYADVRVSDGVAEHLFPSGGAWRTDITSVAVGNGELFWLAHDARGTRLYRGTPDGESLAGDPGSVRPPIL
jgi:hypothetical protein